MNAIYTPERAREFVRIVRDGITPTMMAVDDQTAVYVGLSPSFTTWEDWYVMAAMFSEQAALCSHSPGVPWLDDAHKRIWLEAHTEIYDEILRFAAALNSFGWLG